MTIKQTWGKGHGKLIKSPAARETLSSLCSPIRMFCINLCRHPGKSRPRSWADPGYTGRKLWQDPILLGQDGAVWHVEQSYLPKRNYRQGGCGIITFSCGIYINFSSNIPTDCKSSVMGNLFSFDSSAGLVSWNISNVGLANVTDVATFCNTSPSRNRYGVRNLSHCHSKKDLPR